MAQRRQCRCITNASPSAGHNTDSVDSDYSKPAIRVLQDYLAASANGTNGRKHDFFGVGTLDESFMRHGFWHVRSGPPKLVSRRKVYIMLRDAVHDTDRTKFDAAMKHFSRLRQDQQANIMLKMQATLRDYSIDPFVSERRINAIIMLANFFTQAAETLPKKDGYKLSEPYQPAIDRLLRIVGGILDAEDTYIPESETSMGSAGNGNGKAIRARCASACVKALWELEYDVGGFWLKCALNPITQKVAVKELLEMPFAEGVTIEKHAWSILKKNIDGLAVAIAESGSPKARAFFLEMLVGTQVEVTPEAKSAILIASINFSTVPEEILAFAFNSADASHPGLRDAARSTFQLVQFKTLIDVDRSAPSAAEEPQYSCERAFAAQGIARKFATASHQHVSSLPAATTHSGSVPNVPLQSISRFISRTSSQMVHVLANPDETQSRKDNALTVLANFAALGVAPYDAVSLMSVLTQTPDSSSNALSFYVLTGAIAASQGPHFDSIRRVAQEFLARRIARRYAALDYADERQFDAARELAIIYSRCGIQIQRTKLLETALDMAELSIVPPQLVQHPQPAIPGTEHGMKPDKGGGANGHTLTSPTFLPLLDGQVSDMVRQASSVLEDMALIGIAFDDSNPKEIAKIRRNLDVLRASRSLAYGPKLRSALKVLDEYVPGDHYSKASLVLLGLDMVELMDELKKPTIMRAALQRPVQPAGSENTSGGDYTTFLGTDPPYIPSGSIGKVPSILAGSEDLISYDLDSAEAAGPETNSETNPNIQATSAAVQVTGPSTPSNLSTDQPSTNQDTDLATSQQSSQQTSPEATPKINDPFRKYDTTEPLRPSRMQSARAVLSLLEVFDVPATATPAEAREIKSYFRSVESGDENQFVSAQKLISMCDAGKVDISLLYLLRDHMDRKFAEYADLYSPPDSLSSIEMPALDILAKLGFTQFRIFGSNLPSGQSKHADTISPYEQKSQILTILRELGRFEIRTQNEDAAAELAGKNPRDMGS